MFDDKDKQLLDLLQKNARMTVSNLAAEVGLSVPATAERIKKLIDNEFISDFRAILNPKQNGYDVTAFIQVAMSSSDYYDDLVQFADDNQEVLECHSITGEGSHILKVRTRNTSSLETLLSVIQKWPGVIKTNTMIVMSSFKENTYLPPIID
jgi:Lrp/AsnC family leucine-responsive transcriptional regulator